MSNTNKWALDITHSEIQFKIKHLMITNVTGGFTKYDVQVSSTGDDFTNANISFTADVASINTNNEQRDGHLKSADFFDAEKFPQITFQSTSFSKVGGDYELQGNLTIKGVGKPVKLSVEYGGLGKDPWGNIKAGFTISGKINRTDWGLGWNVALEAGGVLVGEDVKISCEIQLVKQG
ncbi:MAG: YceI family protein [Thermoflexibacteraceae bacterium]